MVYTESSDLDGASLLPRFVGGRQYLRMRLLSIGRQGCASPTALLGGADMFIGTSLSTVGRLAVITQIGRLGRVPPFVFLDKPMGCLWDLDDEEKKAKQGIDKYNCIA